MYDPNDKFEKIAPVIVAIIFIAYCIMVLPDALAWFNRF